MSSQSAGSQPSLADPKPPRGTRFWLVYVALCISLLLAALDLGAVGTAAPTIVSDLHGHDFSWVASAYSLSSAACLPFSGKLAQIFGRRPTMLGALLIFAAGSAVSGSATSMSILIVGRAGDVSTAIQGVGGGGIQAMSSIVTADLVPLRDRGFFTGITGVIYTLGSVSGPFIAGGLAQDASWRWLFYMNLPICAVAMVVVFLFLQLKTPRDSFREKIMKLDWIGNVLIISSTTAIILGITWGGIRYPWSSPRVLCPLILGVVGLAGALVYEAKWAKQPTVPIVVLSNPTSIAGYIATFLHGIVAITSGFYLPTWFQAVWLAGPVRSGLYFLPISATISPAAIAQGLIVAKLGHYRMLNFAGWAFMLIGMGLFTTLRVGTPMGAFAVFQIIQGLGMGLLYCTYFPVMAPLPLEQNASAVALVTFVRAFAQAWGVAISGTILQNALARRLPAAVLAGTPGGTALAYTVIPRIPQLAPALRAQTQQAFCDAMREVWLVMLALCAAGVLTVAVIRDFPLRKTTDRSWGLKEKERARDAERARQDEAGDDKKSAGEGGDGDARAGEAEVVALEELRHGQESGTSQEEERA
ncbi:hypothetical protein PHLGIDRAFT_119585 [Phlebiopsis gigantea 11061_1 CR5-6]|uniref:Major facilitator superfamily (MFS) profile domain-containing protein n=1 Tax=Phlebiopsis gigantea (strain 11061_1 CR5-6) TaxID=745531 RepID=A0A0C3RW30_PHLG1|nr:hypothetical protein PHLGIDRAFT_119585 [Phlebiopsis gigantea 11061_1 CR5-6]